VRTWLHQENSEPGETLVRNEEKEKRSCGGTLAYGVGFTEGNRVYWDLSNCCLRMHRTETSWVLLQSHVGPS
jgi:hypothetical protein